MALVLIRHPQPEVAAGICYGKTDLLLREAALVSAKKLKARLISHLLLVQAPLHMACSPLRRCAALGAALAQLQPNIALSLDPRLQELDFGSWEMQAWDSIGKPAIDTWIASNFAALHGGESLQTLDARVNNWLGDIESYAGHNPTLLVITHVGVIRSVLRQKKICNFAQSLAFPIDYGRSVAIKNSNLLWSNQ